MCVCVCTLVTERPPKRAFPQEETPEPKDQAETTDANCKRFSLLRSAQVPAGAKVYSEDLRALRLGRGSFIGRRVAEAAHRSKMHGYRDFIGQFKCGNGFTC